MFIVENFVEPSPIGMSHWFAFDLALAFSEYLCAHMCAHRHFLLYYWRAVQMDSSSPLAMIFFCAIGELCKWILHLLSCTLVMYVGKLSHAVLFELTERLALKVGLPSPIQTRLCQVSPKLP